MSEEDLMELYALMRGSSECMTVMDARGLFLRKDYDAVLQKLTPCRERYALSKVRVLRSKPVEEGEGKSKDEIAKNRRLLKKQTRVNEVLEKMDSILEVLGPMAERARKRNAAKPTKEAQPPPPEETSSDTAEIDASGEETLFGDEPLISSEQFHRLFSQLSDADSQRALISRAYDIQNVVAARDVTPGNTFFIDGGSRTYLAVTRTSSDSRRVRLKSVLTGERLKSIDMEIFLKLGQRGKVIRLVSKTPMVESDDIPTRETELPIDLDDLDSDEPGKDEATEQTLERAPVESELQESAEVSKVLDKGAFSQLADAASRTGICPGAERIAHVRDREFRKGNFQEALQAIEGVAGQFSSAATARAAKLRQEEADINSGRIQISPKELQAKRARDRAQTQLIDRASNRFSRVLDGLRVLLRRDPVEN